jgi:hypothetical protein
MLLVVSPACGFVTGTPGQEGSPSIANRSADAFLRALLRKDVDYAWSHLAGETQQRVYAGDKQAFTRDVREADWSGITWEFGPVVNHDYAWGVHIRIGPGERLPGFLVERKLAAAWTGSGMVLLVITPDGEPYLISAQGDA